MINRDRLVKTFMDIVSIDSVSSQTNERTTAMSDSLQRQSRAVEQIVRFQVSFSGFIAEYPLAEVYEKFQFTNSRPTK